MACEFLYNPIQEVALNAPILFDTSIPCSRGYVYHEGETGNFILKGIVNNPCANFAQYQVTFNGNIAIPEGGTVAPSAIAMPVGVDLASLHSSSYLVKKHINIPIALCKVTKFAKVN